MIALIAALALAPQTADLVPTDDIWVYSHASDTKEPLLRVWGADGRDVAADPMDADSFGYTYMKWDISNLPTGKLKEAKLILTHVLDPGWTLDYATAHPLLARPVPSGFTEKTWDFARIDKFSPRDGDLAIFGSGVPAKVPMTDKDAKFSIDLLKGPNDFGKYLADARASKVLAIALTSKMDVESMGQGSIYKFYSKDAESASKRPILHLVFESGAQK